MDSNEIAEEMINLYKASRTRDVQFGPTKMRPGTCEGCDQGPLLSQFLFHDVKDGQLEYAQEYYTLPDYELTLEQTIDGLNGKFEYIDEDLNQRRRLDKGPAQKISSPRGLGSLVYGDYPGTEAAKAALIAHSAGVETVGEG